MISIFCSYCSNSNPHGQLNCLSCGALLSFDEVDPNHLFTGTFLKQGQYKIEKTLGQGGFAITYKVIDLNNNSRVVAIKELWPERAGREGSNVRWPYTIPPNERQVQIKKFKEEAQRLLDLVKFNHPSIVKVYEYFEENNTIYIVMEFINGKTLLKILQEEGVLPEKRVKKYFLQLAYALKIIHGNDILHRDIKPDNIIINHQDRAILIDFGAARDFLAGRSKNMTQILTPGYAPPEQYSPRAIRYPSADIYSLCASMYELLTGQLPANASDRTSSKTSTPTGTDSLILPRQLSSHISSLMEKIILTGMKLKAEERFKDADHLIEAFNGNFMSPLFIQARELVKNGKLAEAVQLYQRCLLEEPDNSKAAVENALILTYLVNPQAENAVYQAIKVQSNDGRLYGALGLLYCRQSNWQEAIKQLQKGVNLAPHESWIWANLGWALAKCGSLQKSLIAVDKALGLDQNSTFALALKVWIFVNQQQWNSAITLAKQAIWNSQQANSQNIGNLQTWIYSCLIVALDRVPNKSVIELEKCLHEYTNQVPDSAFVYGFNGYLQAKQGQWANAIAEFNLGVAKSKVPFWILLNLGISYENEKNLQAAIQVYKSCHHLQSKDFFVLFRLGTILGQEAQRLDKQELWLEARSYLELAVQLKPDYAEAYHNIGWVLHHIRNNNDLIDNPAKILATYRQAVQFYDQQNKSALAQQIRQAFQFLGVQL
ncbi:MAG: protein kinase [Desmonostoc geniculatum HA4340-LM1]|jgi:serine/threonine protein kinase|nr:protein kinase [Desmonostoc geniculatum HA4340-LM1]